MIHLKGWKSTLFGFTVYWHEKTCIVNKSNTLLIRMVFMPTCSWEYALGRIACSLQPWCHILPARWIVTYRKILCVVKNCNANDTRHMLLTCGCLYDELKLYIYILRASYSLQFAVSRPAEYKVMKYCLWPMEEKKTTKVCDMWKYHSPSNPYTAFCTVAGSFCLV